MKRIDKELLVQFCFSQFSNADYKLDELSSTGYYGVDINECDEKTVVGSICVQLEHRAGRHLVRYDFKYNANEDIISCRRRLEWVDGREEVIDEFNEFANTLANREEPTC